MMRGGATAELAEDLAIETFVKLWRRSSTFDPYRTSVAGWIFTIARNARIDHWRKERHPDDLTFGLDMAPALRSPEDDLVTSEREKSLQTALTALPPDQLKLLHLSYFEHSTHTAIASALNMPLGTVKSRIRLALKRLRGSLDSQGW